MSIYLADFYVMYIQVMRTYKVTIRFGGILVWRLDMIYVRPLR